ncbi:protein RALF-like 24 [Rosa sericea]
MSKLRDNPILILYLGLLLILTHFSICNGASVLDLSALKGSEIDVKVGDWITEPEMDSEISRRVLAMQKRYISYETLRRDLVPCARPGASYYNCHAVVANPYNRGCEVITGCRGTHDIKT